MFRLDTRQLRQVVDFVYAFPSNLAPAVGQQITLGPNSGADATARVNLLMQRDGAPFALANGQTATECDLVAKGVVGGVQRGFLFQPSQGGFLDDAGATISATQLLAQAQTPGQELTFTCIYPGGGRRFGIDRDRDGQLDSVGAPAPEPPAPQPPLNFFQLLFQILFGGFLTAPFGG